MEKFSDSFEKAVSFVLIVFVMLIIAFMVVQLAWNTVENFIIRFNTIGFAYAPEHSKTIAILFFNVLLMMEIMETIKVFSSSHIIKVRIILIVCLIAVSRKILALGEVSVDPMAEFALAGLILSLSVGYHLVSRYVKEDKSSEDETKP